MSTIGERIKKLRKIHEYNQVEFSNMIGVSQGTLSELEQDKYKHALETIMGIHNKFKTDLYWLVSGVEHPKYFDISKGLGEVEKEFILLFFTMRTQSARGLGFSISIIVVQMPKRNLRTNILP